MPKKKFDGFLDDQTGVFVLDPNRERQLRKSYAVCRIKRKLIMALYPAYEDVYRSWASEENTGSRNNRDEILDLDAQTLASVRETIKTIWNEIEECLKSLKRPEACSDVTIPDEETLKERIMSDMDLKSEKLDEEERIMSYIDSGPSSRHSNSDYPIVSFIINPQTRKPRHEGDRVPKNNLFEIRDIAIIMNKSVATISRSLDAIDKESTTFWKDRLDSIVHEGRTGGKRCSMSFSKEIFPLLCDFREYLLLKKMMRPPRRDPRSPEEMMSTWQFWKSLKEEANEDTQWMDEAQIPDFHGWGSEDEKSKKRAPKIRQTRTAPQQEETTSETFTRQLGNEVTSKDSGEDGFPEL